VANALLYPISIAFIRVLLASNSSRILSKIRTFASTAMPIVRIMPAIPGRVRVAPNEAIAPIISITFIIRAILATKPAFI